MNRLFQGIVGLIAGVGLLVGSFAYANDDEKRARDLFREGVELLQSGQFAPALERFETAYDHWRNPKILLNIATTLRNLERLPEAADMYELYLADPGADDSKSEEVRQALAEIDGKLGRLSIEVGMDGATVWINDTRIERTQTPTTKHLVRTLALLEAKTGRWRVRIMPGVHTVRVSKQGYETRTETLGLHAGEERTLDMGLEPEQDEPEQEVPEPQPDESLSHSGQVLLFTRADVDGKMRGAVAAIGVGYGLGSVVDLGVAGLVGRDKGVEAGASFHFATGLFKPMAYVGVPVFFVEGASPGVHAALGLQVDPWSNFGAFVQVGGAMFLNVPEDRETTVFVPSLGIQGRL